MKCSTCGKDVPFPPVQKDDAGLAGYIATHQPMPEKAWCCEACYVAEQGNRKAENWWPIWIGICVALALIAGEAFWVLRSGGYL